MTAGFGTIAQALDDLAVGRPVVVVDDADRENEGDLIFAAEHATAAQVAFMVRHTSGFICVSLSETECDRLDLPPMYHTNQDRRGTAYTVTVDARAGVTTGISAADRAHTMRLLADPATSAADLSRPGHVVPLRARAGGVLHRPGHTEAAVDLARLAGLRPAGVLCELVNDDGTMMRLPDLEKFCADHGLTLITIADLITHRRRTESHVERVAQARLPMPYGEFRAVGYRVAHDPAEHIALVLGDVGDGGDVSGGGAGRAGDGHDVLVRVHSECLTGDVFGSLRCDCGPQLDTALRLVAAEGRGIVLYLRGHEGRGIGLADKLHAYHLQDQGRDTVDANLALGLPADARDYGTGAQILHDLGVRSVRLLTNNPAKVDGLEAHGVTVLHREPLTIHPRPENLRYLRTKRDRMGHLLQGLDEIETTGIAGGRA
ncbi:bifunctional 3,4-dihydroxy-2-butanone-4-phosphate synthase/GTP cyclohydrolase II [Solwaraspora sp. WMMD406]|uniref:bifunctional 3,4-dihydroxy-2-butanone-4-phosphate synthase/GTP cyclohydrolase II n=1 Tax=Solwaraspora sp. WMMD406 TaxID=3016095 RepID=UPI0024164AF1|nr:bifunctional 3,4-dihydroxy-2-butanone-4-phosphate synthase/GTP cyclohydrolase II [Solwaraspora sp. WMMD406]MDG4766437.1 bifunctional 3,4-dihydroxy-2-butanone-4-phosphate synthase/GTP cyclohydrolase II [Solwaraspora sp. WMMD406]